MQVDAYLSSNLLTGSCFYCSDFHKFIIYIYQFLVLAAETYASSEHILLSIWYQNIYICICIFSCIHD